MVMCVMLEGSKGAGRRPGKGSDHPGWGRRAAQCWQEWMRPDRVGRSLPVRQGR